MIARHGKKAGIVLETLLIVAGLALLVQASMMGASSYKFIHLAEATEGVILGIENHGFTLDIQFAAKDGPGAVISQTGLLFDHRLGEHVPVLYDPESPTTAMMDNIGAIWFRPVAMGAPGFLLLAFGFRLRSERNL